MVNYYGWEIFNTKTLFMIVVLTNGKNRWIYLQIIKMLFVHVQVYQKQKFEFDQRHPVLLPSSNYFTKLLILYTHDKVCHAGVESTLTELRLKYWIIKGRQTVWKVINPCVTSKKVQGKVLRQPPTPALPEYQVCAEFPFQVTGFDFADPLFVKDICSKCSDVNKCFILIFTCANKSIYLFRVVSRHDFCFIY